MPAIVCRSHGCANSLGNRNTCGFCIEHNVERRRSHSAKRKDYFKAYRALPTTRLNARKAKLKNKYGMSLVAYDALLASQGGLCHICRQPPKEGTDLHVDHCHASNKVRGLLCGCCNRALGLFRDDPLLLIAAMRYLDGAG